MHIILYYQKAIALFLLRLHGEGEAWTDYSDKYLVGQIKVVRMIPVAIRAGNAPRLDGQLLTSQAVSLQCKAGNNIDWSHINPYVIIKPEFHASKKFIHSSRLDELHPCGAPRNSLFKSSGLILIGIFSENDFIFNQC